ncbi:MAG: hypothetical protein CFH34_00913 [Alphaproteobacteria bacterium MarineAlpha9_Bin4]|nr:MAG: hypothetical protein CFH34_00913 [Alphaproteobacteria bacterium MarineAlpha9_Bin4]|tara:strand:+ start:3399 stop:3851 length:453 start_codon:yes stop_codon:yes gene_type:complete
MTSKIHCKEFDLKFNLSGSYKKNEMIFLDKSKISHNVYESEWTDNYGNYGTSYCLTSIKYNNKAIIIELDSYCKLNDQAGNKFTLHNSRKGNELSAGSGKALFIEGQGKWKKIIGATCVYSIRYLDDRTFSIRKCSINEDMHKHLSKYNN